MHESPGKGVEKGPQVSVFRDINGRESKVRIFKKVRIGSGVFGTIYRAEGEVVGVDEKTKNIPNFFILKDFFDDDDPAFIAGARKKATTAQETFSKLKDAGIKTWSTYRLESPAGFRILMTDGETAPNSAVVTVGAESDSWDVVKEMKLTQIVNIQASVTEALEQLNKANKAGLSISGDSWMYRFTKQGAGLANLDIFIGDFDGISTSRSKLKEQRSRLEKTIKSILNSALPDKEAEEHNQKVKELFKEAI